MKLLTIPLDPVPNQEVSVMLSDIPYTLTIQTRNEALYITIFRDGEYVLYNRALRSFAPVEYGFQMIDTEGQDDPQYSGLGSRWQLLALVA